jgi:hypothetical protein
MSGRCALSSTTMLSGMVGCTFLTASAAFAADLSIYAKAPAQTFSPAVDGFNVKLDSYGGSVANRSIYGGTGSLSMPLGGQYGLQIDGNLASLDGDAFGVGGGHWFWRNPSQALFGIYGSSTFWDRFGGVNVNHVGAETELYLGAVTLQGVAGVEFGNSATRTNTSVVTTPTVITTTTFAESFSIKTRFFDQINLKYYFNSDLSGYIGHRYLGGRNALALGAELARPLGGGLMASAFVEGRVGENDNHGIWGGLKLYFGRTDKPLLERNRRDDPAQWSTDTAFSLFGANHTGSSLSTSTPTCFGTVVDGICEVGVFFGSDRRLKRDIVLLTRLTNSIGLYRFRYLWSDTVYVGVMAQEVAEIAPEAVTRGTDGFLRVNYERLGLRLLTLNEWRVGKRPRLAA